jgi:hypothetical protein
MTIPFKNLKAVWMKDPAFRAEYERLKPDFARALRKAAGGRAAGKSPRRNPSVNIKS